MLFPPPLRRPIHDDRYGHLMPGSEEQAAALVDAYLERANTLVRLAQVEGTEGARASTRHYRADSSGSQRTRGGCLK